MITANSGVRTSDIFQVLQAERANSPFSNNVVARQLLEMPRPFKSAGLGLQE
jgi:hypothetical protein